MRDSEDLVHIAPGSAELMDERHNIGIGGFFDFNAIYQIAQKALTGKAALLDFLCEGLKFVFGEVDDDPTISFSQIESSVLSVRGY